MRVILFECSSTETLQKPSGIPLGSRGIHGDYFIESCGNCEDRPDRAHLREPRHNFIGDKTRAIAPKLIDRFDFVKEKYQPSSVYGAKAFGQRLDPKQCLFALVSVISPAEIFSE